MRRSATLLLLSLAGCTGLSSPDPDAYTREGQRFGVVDGTFRGRWWNHYERGRSYLDGGFHAEAAADFRTALALRDADQRWARTYGLHFIPEYFPNRELGITRYHEGQLDEAERLLQRSLEQEHSALAEHFLEQVHAAQVAEAGGDDLPPVITADARSLTQAANTGLGGMLHLVVEDNTYITRVAVEGAPQALAGAAPRVALAVPVTLASGDNAIAVEATDIAGNRTEISVSIPRDFDGPAVSFEVAGGGLIAGMVYDPAGIEAITVGDAPLALEPLPDGTARFQRVATPNDLAAPLTYTATDSLGNTTTGLVPQAALPATAQQVRARQTVASTLSNAALATVLAQDSVTPASADGIRLSNLAPGQRYLMEEIVVVIEAVDADGIRGVELNGVPLTGLVPDARAQFVSRRIRLDALGDHRIAARMTDAAGNATDAEVTITRAPTAIEQPEEHLRVALLGNLWEGAGPKLENEAGFVAEELTAAIYQRGRVDVLSRDALPRVLEEQELRTVLGSRDLEPGLRQIVPADVLAVGKVRRTGDTMEIVLQAVSTETSHIVAYADVAGDVRSADDLRALTRDLALRFEQEFPRVTGLVVDAPSASRCFTTLAEADRVRPELPCIVYRFGDPIVHPGTGAVLGRPTQIIARGRIDEVQRQLSRLRLDAPVEAGDTVQVNDHVATR